MRMIVRQVDEDTFVPSTYTEMVLVYKTYVTKLVQKYNRVISNFEDLLQHTWQKLVEANLIEKYNKSMGNQTRHLLGGQVALYLKMTWNQFKVFMWRAHKGDKRPTLQNSMEAKMLDRDRGICRDACHGGDGLDTLAFSTSLKVQQEKDPEAYRAKRKELKEQGIGENTWRFWDVEVINKEAKGTDRFRTVCLFCLAKQRMGGLAVERSKSSTVLTPVKGSRGSKAAVYDVLEVEKVRIQREESKRCKEQPGYEPFVIPQTKSRFKLYLARAVHNIYANWCRTRSRRYKEMYLAPMEDGTSWESFLEDSGRNNPEAKFIVTEEVNLNLDRVVDKLQKKVREGYISREQIEERVASGFTVSEILKEFDLPRATLQVVCGRYG